jgi:hypothetical protein
MSMRGLRLASSPAALQHEGNLVVGAQAGPPSLAEPKTSQSPELRTGETSRRRPVLNAILSLGSALSFAAGQELAPRKPFPADVGSGRIARFDITTSNMAQSRGFYAKLFDWSFAPVEGTDQAVEVIA